MHPKNLMERCQRDYLLTKALDESGAALAIALMFLVVLTLIGSAAIITSITEMDIAGNEKQHQMAFYASDGGADLTPKIIRDTITLYSEPVYGANVVVTAGFLDELMNFTSANNDGATDSSQNNPDISIPALTTSMTVGIDVDRGNTINLPGGAREMGSGYEGIGGGTAGGGTAVMFDIESRSQGPRNSSTDVQTQYLYVIGVGG
jgi:Tfp pilus assembly protein PilX